MPTINLPPSLKALFANIESRLQKLETGKRFTAPAVPQITTLPTITGSASGDPSTLRVGDVWLNTTSNTIKYVDKNGAVTPFLISSVPYGPRYIKTGWFYGPIGLVNQGTAMTLSANVAYAVPVYIANTATALYLSLNVASLNGASGGVRIGLYSNSTTDDYPSTLIVDGGVIPTDTVLGATGPNLAIISQVLNPGLYWLVAVRQGVSNPSIYGLSLPNYSASSEIFPTGTLGSTSYGGVGWLMSGVAGALPTTWTATKTLDIQAPAVSIGF